MEKVNKTAQEYLDYIKCDNKNASFLDINGAIFNEQQFNELIKLTFGFAIDSKKFSQQITNLAEDLNINNKPLDYISNNINEIINNLLKFDDLKDAEEFNNKIGKEFDNTNNKAGQIFNQFTKTISNDIYSVLNSSKKKWEQKDIAIEIQKNNLQKIITALEDSLDYWINDFQSPLPQNKSNKTILFKKIITEIKNTTIKEQYKKIYDLFRKLQATESGCDFLKLLTAMVVSLRPEFAELNEKTQNFSKELLDQLNFKDVEKIDEYWNSYVKKIAYKEYFECKCSARGKSQKRVATKLLSNIDFNPEKAIYDGIGLRFEVENKADAVRLIDFCLNLKNGALPKIGAHSFSLRTRKLFNDQFENETQLKHNSVLPSAFYSAKIDPVHAEEFFEDVRILGIDKNGDKFEIQIVIVGNTNESGLSHHKIWEAIGTASAKARISNFITDEELAIYKKTAFINSTNTEEVKVSLADDYEKKHKKRPSINQLNVEWLNFKKEKEAGISKRFKDNTVKIESGKHVFINPKDLYKYRLTKTDLLSTEEKDKINQLCFIKWLEKEVFKYANDTKIFLPDPNNPNYLVSFNKYQIPSDVYDKLKESWLNNTKKDQEIFAKIKEKNQADI